MDLYTFTHEEIQEPHTAVIALVLTPEVEVNDAKIFAHEYEGRNNWPVDALRTLKKSTLLENKPCLWYTPEYGQPVKIGVGWVLYAGHGMPVQAEKLDAFLEAYRPIPVSVGPAEGQDVP